MTKARGAFDSIGKAGRGASFLLPAFSPYYAPYFPLFLCARVQRCTYTRTNMSICSSVRTYTRIYSIFYPEEHTFTWVLFFSCFFASITFHYFCLYLLYQHITSISMPVFLTLVQNFFRSSLCFLSLFYHLNYYTRFHVMWLYAFAVRGQLYTLYVGERENVFWNLSRSLSIAPLSVIYTRFRLGLLRK